MEQWTLIQENNKHGLTVWTTSVFIVGNIAGGGVLALPKAVEDTGWIGFILIIVFGIFSTYTATLIGDSWVIIQERYPEYRSHVPDPYPVIGEKAYGRRGRNIVNVVMNVYNYGSAVVYMVLAAGNIETLLAKVTKDISLCYWLIILAGVLAPLICLGTPKDFWPIGVGATFTTGIACILIIIQSLNDKDQHMPVSHSTTDPLKFSTSFGTMVFAVSGHSVLPTIINDMKKKEDFKKAAFLGYAIVLMMYMPTAVVGYMVYGKNLNENIIKSVSAGPCAYTVEVLVTLHLLLGFIILMNPVCQQFEAKLSVPTAFTWKRCVIRPLIVISVLFIAESIPHFGSILSLVGGLTTTLLSYVFPCLFYTKLCKNDHETGRNTKKSKTDIQKSSESHSLLESVDNTDSWQRREHSSTPIEDAASVGRREHSITPVDVRRALLHYTRNSPEM
ncbi:SLC32A [Mytilus coruscus]|uniref:SLC32A n=1 Tax=Mytilus coruscus TaxID=42192 RepID=A0A6J8EJU9_MYTCO|nr:SLC32A [Mytilus coruscus]